MRRRRCSRSGMLPPVGVKVKFSHNCQNCLDVLVAGGQGHQGVARCGGGGAAGAREAVAAAGPEPRPLRRLQGAEIHAIF